MINVGLAQARPNYVMHSHGFDDCAAQSRCCTIHGLPAQSTLRNTIHELYWIHGLHVTHVP